MGEGYIWTFSWFRLIVIGFYQNQTIKIGFDLIQYGCIYVLPN